MRSVAGLKVSGPGLGAAMETTLPPLSVAAIGARMRSMPEAPRWQAAGTAIRSAPCSGHASAWSFSAMKSRNSRIRCGSRVRGM